MASSSAWTKTRPVLLSISENFLIQIPKCTFTTGDHDLFLIGRLRYTDIFGKPYVMGFCAAFGKDGNNLFLMRGGRQYNYARQERNPRFWRWRVSPKAAAGHHG